MAQSGLPPAGGGGRGQSNLTYEVSVDDPHAYFYFNLPTGNTNFAGQSQKGPNIFSLNAPSSNQYKAETKAALVPSGQAPAPATGWFWGNFTFSSPNNGFQGQYIIGGNGQQNPNSTPVHWTMGLDCVTSPYCYLYGNNGICLGGNYLEANLVSSNVATVQIAGNCPPPQGKQ